MPFQNLILRVGADVSALKQQLYRARTEITGFHNFVQGQMSQIAAALTGTVLTLGVGDAIRDAVKVEGALEQVKRLMGESAQEFIEFSKTTSETLGMSRAEALDYGRTYANLTSIFSKSTAETMQTTQDLMKASAIVSSATGRSMEDVMFRIRSGLLGNTEAVEDLGVTVYINMIEASDAMKKFANGKSWNQLDFRLQQQIRYYAILEQVQKKFGDEIYKNTGFRINQFAATLKDLKLEIGNAFLPLVNVALPYLTAFARRLVEAMSFVAAFSRELFGVTKEQATIKKLDTTSSAVKDVGSSAASSAKKMKGFLAGFDEINSVPDPEQAAGDAAGGMSAGMGDPQLGGGIFAGAEEVNVKAREMALTVKNAFTQVATFLSQNKEIIIASMAGIAAGYVASMLLITTANRTAGLVTFWTNIKNLFASIGAAISLLFTPIGLVVVAIAALAAGFVYLYRNNEQFRESVNNLLAQIVPALQSFYDTVLVPLGTYLGGAMVVAFDALSEAAVYLWNNVLVPLGSFIADVFVAAWDGLVATVTWLWQEVFVPFGEFLDLMGKALDPFAVAIKDSLGMAFSFLGDVATIVWQDILSPFFTAMGELFSPAVDALAAVFNVLWKVVEAIGTIFKWVIVIITGFFSLIGRAIWEVLKPFVTFAKDVFLAVFKNIGITIKGVIEGTKKTFMGILNFITGVFTGDWKKAFTALGDIIVGAFEMIWAGVKFPLNMLIDGVNMLIRGLNKINIDIPGWVPGYGGEKFGINIPEIPKLARGGIVNSPTMAMIGEAGSEMVVPLENTGFVDKLSSALGTAVMSAMQMTGNQRGNQEVVIKLDGNVLARAINPYTQKESARVGTNLITIT